MARPSKEKKAALSSQMLAASRCLLVLAVCQACCGCTLLTNGSHILLTDPLHFPNNLNHLAARKEHRKAAERFLDEFHYANPEFPLSKEFIDGFLDGFVDYVTYGPRTAPPALPPRRYWKKGYASPAGYAAIQDWHAGFAEGSHSAASSGLREFQTVPSSSLSWRTEMPIGSEVLPDVIPQPQETISSPGNHDLPEPTSDLPPANSDWPGIVPPEVDIAPESQDQQASQQTDRLLEPLGTMQPAIHGAESRNDWAEPSIGNYDSPTSPTTVQQVFIEDQPLVEPAATTVRASYQDDRLQFDEPPAPPPSDEPSLLTPSTSKSIP